MCSSCKHYEIHGDRGWCPKKKKTISWDTFTCSQYKKKEEKEST